MNLGVRNNIPFNGTIVVNDQSIVKSDNPDTINARHYDANKIEYIEEFDDNNTQIIYSNNYGHYIDEVKTPVTKVLEAYNATKGDNDLYVKLN